jgi:hypothetical protein
MNLDTACVHTEILAAITLAWAAPSAATLGTRPVKSVPGATAAAAIAKLRESRRRRIIHTSSPYGG